MVDTRLERVNIRPGRLLLGLARVDILGWRELILGLGRLILGLARVDILGWRELILGLGRLVLGLQRGVRI